MNKAYNQLHTSTEVFLLDGRGFDGVNGTLSDVYKDCLLGFVVGLDPNVRVGRVEWPGYGDGGGAERGQGKGNVLEVKGGSGGLGSWGMRMWENCVGFLRGRGWC